MRHQENSFSNRTCAAGRSDNIGIGLSSASLMMLLMFSACGSAKEAVGVRDVGTAMPHETLNSAVWMQLSAEYKASTVQAYNAALVHLSAALADSSWSAIPNTTGHAQKPPAIIVDVDETVLDNSPFEARMIRADTVYNRPAWNAWVEERKAEAVPGALRFLNMAADRGVTVFYVTNRSSELDAATTDNLTTEGFPLPKGAEQVLTRGERKEWTGDKATRRDHVARDYRVLFLAGDDLNDFVSTDELSTDERAKLVERYQDFWGERWIILPNPTYGSWERTINGEAGARYRQDRIRAKVAALRSKE